MYLIVRYFYIYLLRRLNIYLYYIIAYVRKILFAQEIVVELRS